MHDTVIGDFSTIAPNAAIMGRVRIGERCYIGANATIIPEITICPDTIIGAGAVVNKSIKEPGTYVGVPAKRIKWKHHAINNSLYYACNNRRFAGDRKRIVSIT